MKVHHIGYAVNDIEDAKKSLSELGYDFGDVIEDKSRKVRISFGVNGAYAVELVSPAGDETPVDLFLNKVGPTPYHICYEVENIEDKIKELRKMGFIQNSKIRKATAINNRRVVFLSSLNAGLIELVEMEHTVSEI